MIINDMQKRVLMIFIVSILLMSSMSAALEYSFILKQNEPAQISAPCTDSSINPCDSNVRCNITINRGDGSTLIDNKVMTLYPPGQYKYNLTAEDTAVIGDYDSHINCIGLESGFARFAYRVTPSGKDGVSNIVFMLILIFLIYAIALFGLFGKNEIITLLGSFALMGLGIYLINEGLIIYRDFITNGLAYISIGLGAYLSFMAAYSLYGDM